MTCSYRQQEFVRVGYFINNEYTDPELRENPPSQPIFEKVQRIILADKPRVTRFKINWDDSTNDTNGMEKITYPPQNMEDSNDFEHPMQLLPSKHEDSNEQSSMMDMI